VVCVDFVRIFPYLPRILMDLLHRERTDKRTGPPTMLSGTLSYIRVLGVIELIEFNHSSLFGVVG